MTRKREIKYKCLIVFLIHIGIFKHSLFFIIIFRSNVVDIGYLNERITILAIICCNSNIFFCVKIVCTFIATNI